MLSNQIHNINTRHLTFSRTVNLYSLERIGYVRYVHKSLTGSLNSSKCCISVSLCIKEYDKSYIKIYICSTVFTCTDGNSLPRFKCSYGGWTSRCRLSTVSIVSATSTTTDMNLKQKVNTVRTYTTLTSPPLLIRQSLVHCISSSTK